MGGDNFKDTHSDEQNDEPMPIDTQNVESAGTVKLPTFWSANPGIWFDSAELQFKLLNIVSDKKKFLYVLTALPPEVSDKISDVIRNPPDTDMFLTIKRTILNRLTPSDEAQLETLLSGLDLGDTRPSDLLRRIKTLAGNNFSPYIMKTLWIRKLPEVLRLSLVAQPDTTTLDELSITADRIFDAMNRSSKIAEISTPLSRATRPALNNTNSITRSNSRGNNISPAPTLQNIMTRLDAMEKRLNTLSSLPGRSRSRTRSRNRMYDNQQRNRSNSGNRNNFTNFSSSNPSFNGTWCVMHNRWKHRAHYCKQPCTFLLDNQVNSVNSAQSKND